MLQVLQRPLLVEVEVGVAQLAALDDHLDLREVERFLIHHLHLRLILIVSVVLVGLGHAILIFKRCIGVLALRFESFDCTFIFVDDYCR